MEQQILNLLKQLVDAGERVVNNWESGDLAGAVSELDGVVDEAKKFLKDQKATAKS